MLSAEKSPLAVGVGFSALYTAAIWLAGPLLNGYRATLLEDEGWDWYYWKLPRPTALTRASCWLSYMLHQACVWYIIYRAQRKKLRYSDSLHAENWLSLGANAAFAVWHLLQTHLFYDGLAQDTTILSSQGSVVFLLIVILIMENRRRGMFFGYQPPLSTRVVDFLRRYHGYYFSLAITYTFWFHPCETSAGHLGGFFYTALLMLQGSLFFTTSHLSRSWRLGLEMLVSVHGASVAIQQTGLEGFWPMFFFGFMAMFVITQMHGLGWSVATRTALFVAYVASVLLMYNTRGWEHITEPLRIPIIDYIGVFLTTWVVAGGLALYSAIRRPAFSSQP